MKHATFTVEFLRHVLANGRGPDGERDVFERDSNKNLIFQPTWWHSAIRKTIQDYEIRGIKPTDISMDLTVTAPTQKWNRHYSKDKSRLHEAIMPGTKVSFEAMVSDSITESNLRNLLELMGKYVGISPYGHNLGYGRFTVVDVTVAPSADA